MHKLENISFFCIYQFFCLWFFFFFLFCSMCLFKSIDSIPDPRFASKFYYLFLQWLVVLYVQCWVKKLRMIGKYRHKHTAHKKRGKKMKFELRNRMAKSRKRCKKKLVGFNYLKINKICCFCLLLLLLLLFHFLDWRIFTPRAMSCLVIVDTLR